MPIRLNVDREALHRARVNRLEAAALVLLSIVLACSVAVLTIVRWIWTRVKAVAGLLREIVQEILR